MDLHAHFHVMIKLKNEELINIVGGSDIISATLLNAITRCMDCIFEIGRAIGSSIARFKSGNICS